MVYVGAHVSVAGGLQKAIQNILEYGGDCFALFVRSQRRWTSPPLKAEEAELFKKALAASGIKPDHVVVHGSYLINLGNPDAEMREQSYGGLLDEMRRCHTLGLRMYNIHPGSAVDGADHGETLARIAEQINRAHKEVEHVVVVLETMAGQGHTVGGSFQDLRRIIDLVTEKDRVGVCLDTCHIFAAGYDIRSPEVYAETMQSFEEHIGMDRLLAIHLNDSKGDLGCRKDRHENIGKGKIGIEGFRNLVRDPRLRGVPMVLETPALHPDVYKEEIALLRSLK